METKILKVKQYLLEEDKMVLIKDGLFFILTKKLQPKLRDSMKNLVSKSTDHSTLSQNFHSTESLSALVPHTSDLRDGETMLPNNNGYSMVSQRPSDLRHGATMPFKFQAMEVQTPLE
jgi:hypothetical protein